MKRAESLKEFTHLLIAYVGTGYCYYKITHIPNRKAHKSPQILQKVSELYQTDLSQGQRQYKRKKGLANYAAVNYRDIIIVFHTNGEHIDNPNEFKELTEKGVELKLSKFLTVILFKDERDKWTYRLGKSSFQFFKGEIEIAFNNSDGKKFHTLKTMFNHLPYYKGIGKQKKELNIYIRQIQKNNKVRKLWDLL